MATEHEQITEAILVSLKKEVQELKYIISVLVQSTTQRYFLKQKKAAQYLGKGEHWLIDKRRGGEIPYCLVEGVFYYEVNDLIAFIARNKTFGPFNQETLTKIQTVTPQIKRKTKKINNPFK